MIQSLSQIPSRTRRFSSGVLTTAAFLLVLPWSVIAQGGSDQDMKVKRAQTSMNFKQAALGVLMYTQDYDGIYPYQGTSAHVFEAVRPYVRKAEFATLNPAGGRMLFNVALSGVRAVSMPKVTETLMLYDENAWPDGKRVVAYADGHVKTIGDSQWSGSKKGLKEKFPKASPNKARNRGN